MRGRSWKWEVESAKWKVRLEIRDWKLEVGGTASVCVVWKRDQVEVEKK